MLESDDDVPQLSAETFTVLQEFYKEQALKDTQIPNNETDFDENWQLSQFWYDQETINILAKIILKILKPEGKVALISCPSIYKTIKTQIVDNCTVTLFEYDKRFEIYGPDFHFYDYKEPLRISRDKQHYYDVVIADPPFLSEECLTKIAVTIKYLTTGNIILCTGAVMMDLAQRLLNVKKCKFEPKHQNNLGNEFYCYANFDVDSVL